MKNIYFFFVFIFITSCSHNLVTDNRDYHVSCPLILFGSDHQNYIGSSINNISLDTIEYSGEINNAAFSKKCSFKDDKFFFAISILFIIKPLIEEIGFTNMPFYLAILNQDKELIDTLYFSAKGDFKTDLETKKVVETEIIKTLSLKHESVNEDFILVIGFVLDKKRKEILN